MISRFRSYLATSRSISRSSRSISISRLEPLISSSFPRIYYDVRTRVSALARSSSTRIQTRSSVFAPPFSKRAFSTSIAAVTSPITKQPANSLKRRKWTPEELKLLENLRFRQGKSFHEIGRILDRNRETCRLVLRERGTGALKRRPWLPKETERLEELYIKRRKSVAEIAKILKRSQGSIRKRLPKRRNEHDSNLEFLSKPPVVRYKRKDWTVEESQLLEDLRVNQGKTFREISQILNRSLGACSIHLRRMNKNKNLSPRKCWRPEELKQLEELRLKQGRPYPEVAGILGRTPSTCRNRLVVSGKIKVTQRRPPMSKKFSFPRWKTGELKLLHDLRLKQGKSFSEIAQIVKRPIETCRLKLRETNKAERNKEMLKWRLEELERLSVCVDKFLQENPGQEIDWGLVSKQFGPSRSSNELNRKWRRSIDPTLKRGKLTSEELNLLMWHVKLHGRKWALIAREHFPGRCDIQLRYGYLHHVGTFTRRAASRVSCERNLKDATLAK